MNLPAFNVTVELKTGESFVVAVNAFDEAHAIVRAIAEINPVYHEHFVAMYVEHGRRGKK